MNPATGSTCKSTDRSGGHDIFEKLRPSSYFGPPCFKTALRVQAQGALSSSFGGRFVDCRQLGQSMAQLPGL